MTGKSERTVRHIFYAAHSGVEVQPGVKQGSGHGHEESEGRVLVRFFLLKPPGSTDKPTQIRFVSEPPEVYDLAWAIEMLLDGKVSPQEYEANHFKVKSSATKTSVSYRLSPHVYESATGKVQTEVGVEAYWTASGDRKFAIFVSRGSDFINVPIPRAGFRFAAAFLKHLALAQCWVEKSGSSA
jgi:hypothetical protein